jgi:HAD superfamily hydrolase (TIGR01509 family)
LEDLRQMKMRLAVPTNSVSASARPFLDRHRLTRFFEVSVTGDEIERGKPHPDIYLCAVERRGVPPDACLVIEDALPGIAAKAAKMHVAAIPDRPRARERSGLYLLGSPSEMAAFNQQLHLAGD